MTITASPDLIDVNALAPDGIEPVEAMRAWNFENGKLLSLNGEEWTPGKPLEARCGGMTKEYRWKIVRGGITREQAQEHVRVANQMQTAFMYPRGPATMYMARVPAPYTADLPDGYGYELETITHDAPHENCTCGIYAATTKNQLPQGVVYGKVKLWGKVIPGEKGVRAQYAYPSEFQVPPELKDHPALKAYGVPIIVDDTTPAANDPSTFQWTPGSQWIVQPPTSQKRRLPAWWVYTAVTVNLAACALNLILAASH